MIVPKTTFFVCIVFFFLTFSCQNTPQKAQNQADITTADYDCATCGMPTQDFARSYVKAEKQVGGETWFCSPRCFFAGRFEAKIDTNFSKIWVVEYYELKKINAKTAFYVTGSDVMGAMGHDFIPLATEQDAKNFVGEHQGKKTWKYDEISPATLKEALKN